MTDTKQLELFRVVTKQPERPPNPEFEAFLEECRREAAEFLAIAIELFGKEWELSLIHI